MRTQTKRNIIGLSIVTLIVVIIAALLYAVKSNALEREIAAWEAAGLPLDLAKLMPPAPPDEENAAVRFLEIMAEVPAEVPSPTEEDADGYLRELGSENELARLGSGASALSLVAEHFAVPAEALRDLLLTDSPWVWPASTYEDELLPTSPHTLDAAKILVLQAGALTREGQADDALAYLHAALRLSEHIAAFPSMVSAIAHAGVDQIALKTLEDMGRSQRLAAAPLEEELKRRNYRATLVRSLHGEAALVWAQREEWPALYRSFTGMRLELWGLKGDAAHYFTAMRAAIDRFDEPYLQQDDPQWEPDEEGGGPFCGAFAALSSAKPNRRRGGSASPHGAACFRTATKEGHAWQLRSGAGGDGRADQPDDGRTIGSGCGGAWPADSYRATARR